MDFTHNMPTRCFFGPNVLAAHGEQIAEVGSRALLITGATSARCSGAQDKVVRCLKELSIPFSLFDEVEPNPSFETLLRGVEAARRFRADMVLGVGGGSPMDLAKGVAVLTNNPEIEHLYSGPYPAPVLPVVALPTTAGTGSEVTPYAVITDTHAKCKRSIATPAIYPRLAYLDPTLLHTLPLSSLLSTVVDALSHATEGYLAQRASPLTDALALEALRTLALPLKTLSALSKGCTSRDTLEESIYEKILYASMVAGMVIAGAGTTIAHGIGYAVTLFKGIDHGRATGLLLPAVLVYNREHQPQKVATLLQALDLNSLDQFAELMEGLLGRVAFSIGERELFARRGAETGNVKNTVPPPSPTAIRTMVESSFSGPL